MLYAALVARLTALTNTGLTLDGGLATAHYLTPETRACAERALAGVSARYTRAVHALYARYGVDLRYARPEAVLEFCAAR